MSIKVLIGMWKTFSSSHSKTLQLGSRPPRQAKEEFKSNLQMYLLGPGTRVWLCLLLRAHPKLLIYLLLRHLIFQRAAERETSEH
jgi:hypothetical protein